MIRRLRLVRYKGFSNFTLSFRKSAVLVGPNNAGKSTVIAALKLCALLLKRAQLRKPESGFNDVTRGRWVQGYALPSSLEGFVAENVRHDFRDVEARIELSFKSGAAIYVVWPEGDEGEPFFYLEHVPGQQPKSVNVVKDTYDSIGIVPALTPIEHRESVLGPSYVKANMSSRLASRHFRNQLAVLEREDPSGYAEMRRFVIENTPEIEKFSLYRRMGSDGAELDLFYSEPGSRTEREIYWAGDGLQIWLQVLFHVWRHRSESSVVLDEPDVFLHPDLQRRLIRVLEDEGFQTILATHAPEILAEANRESVVIVDRTRRNSRRVGDAHVLGVLSDALGSAFNLRLARALRSKVALFVEGQDNKILRNIARIVGATALADEQGITVIAMGGYSNNRLAWAFGWLSDELLDGAVKIVTIVDRDYRTEESVSGLVKDFEGQGIDIHVWRKKELESYLLVPETISRVSGVSVEKVNEYIDAALDYMRVAVFSRYINERRSDKGDKAIHDVNLYDRCIPEFESSWADRSWRLSMAPPKDVLSAVNRSLQASGGKAVSARNLSTRIRSEEVAPEMKQLLRRIDGAISGGGSY